METIFCGIDTSSEEEEEVREVNLNRRSLRDSSNIFELSDTRFKSLFRLSKDAFLFIVERTKASFKPSIRSSRISPICKIATTFRFLSHGSYQNSVGQEYFVAMGQSTVCKVIEETLTILEDLLCPELINFQMTKEEKLQAKKWFFDRTGFPSIIGAIDGTHINIIRPNKNEHLYYNRKGNHSINAMVICDNKMRIRSINARYGGVSHDFGIWAVSAERLFLEKCWNEKDKNSWLLGDSGYPIEPWLMTPYRLAPEGSAAAKYNTQHSKARNIVERVFGVLKGRFRCLLSARELHYTPIKAGKIINVCCALHNLCIKFNVELNSSLNVNEEHENVTINTSEQQSETQRANNIRDQIRNSLI